MGWRWKEGCEGEPQVPGLGSCVDGEGFTEMGALEGELVWARGWGGQEIH